MGNISMINNHAEVVGTTSVSKIFQLLKDPASPHRKTIEEIRHAYQCSGKSTANELKKELKGFTCSGIFRKRRVTKNLVSYSGLLMLDLDNLSPSSLVHIKAIIEGIPYTHLCFVSPSGFGLKVIVKVDSPAEFHKTAYEQVKKYYEEETGEKFDKTSDVARLTYISYDESAYYCEDSLVFNVEVKPIKKRIENDAVVASSSTVDHEQLFEKALALIKSKFSFEEGSRNTFIVNLACLTNKYGLPPELVISKSIELFAMDWEEAEIINTISGVYNRYSDQFGIWQTLEIPKGQSAITDEPDAKVQTAQDNAENTPCIPEELIKRLPRFISSVAALLSNKREADTFVTGALTVLSGCLFNVTGIYDGRKYYANLNSFIIAPASSGKGVLMNARQLAYHTHNKLLNESKEAKDIYEKALSDYNSADKHAKKDMEKPEKPPFITLFVPGNSSSASIYAHLNECDGIGIVCESEADTVNYCLKNDWGNYSDLIRKSFHHEHVSSRRKSDNEYIEVEEPRLSVALSSTPSQVNGLIRSAEDGLFSRFIFYRFQVVHRWRDVSPKNGKADLPNLITKNSAEITTMVEFLKKYPTDFRLSDLQWGKLNTQFGIWLNEVSCLITEEASASVMRLGLICFRIAMILSAIRKYELSIKEQVVYCTDENFEIALSLASIYLQHALVMFKELPNSSKLDGKRKQFFDLLPLEFSRDTAIELARKAGLKESVSWIDRWLKRFVTYEYLQKIEYNLYRKIKIDVGGSASILQTLPAFTKRQ